MKITTFISLMFFGVACCGWVFGKVLSGTATGGFSGIMLALVSMVVGQFTHAVWTRVSESFRDKTRNAQQALLAKKVTMVVNSLGGITEAICRKVVVRVAAEAVRQDDRVGVISKADAIIDEEMKSVNQLLTGEA